MDFLNKKILIIGGSSGIGEQTAVQLSKRGASVLLAARREDRLREVIKGLAGDGHQYIKADMSEVADVEKLFKQIREQFGPLDGMLYSAGSTATRPLSMLKPDTLAQVMTVHFFSFIEAVRQFSRKGAFNEGARIVGMSSIAAKCGDKGHLAYSSAKAAIEGAVRCLAIELAEKKICVNAVAAGMTKTEMLKDFLQKNSEDSDAYRKIVDRQYLGIGDPRQIADAICFLLSPSSSFITGASIPVDGGYTAC